MFIYVLLESNHLSFGRDSLMEIKCSVYIATSLDGFIAKPDGNTNWLHNPEYVLEGEDFGYNAFMESVSALIMGRHTYEQVLTFKEWPYIKPVFVLSSKNLKVPEELKGKIQFLNGNLSEVLSELSQQGFRHFYVDGGKTIQQFLNQGLIKELTITQIPLLLGDGIPLFGSLEKELKLNLISSKGYENGFVKSTYEVINL